MKFTIIQSLTEAGYRFRVAERDAYLAYCEQQRIPFANLSIDYDVADSFRHLVAPVAEGVKMVLFPRQDGLTITIQPG